MSVLLFQNVSASLWLLLFIAIKKRQWCLECILKFEGFAKTKGFLLCSDLHFKIVPLIAGNFWSIQPRKTMPRFSEDRFFAFALPLWYMYKIPVFN